ncbi:unnamed protein product, partial [Prorocentrum cordatum]
MGVLNDTVVPQLFQDVFKPVQAQLDEKASRFSQRLRNVNELDTRGESRFPDWHRRSFSGASLSSFQGLKYWHGPQGKARANAKRQGEKDEDEEVEAQVVLKTPCRICHCLEDDLEDPLVAPCACSGSLRCVHSSCQRAWLLHRPGPLEYKCELCGHALACHLRLSTRVEIITTLVISASAWTLQLWSLVRTLLLAARVVVATYLCRFSGAHPQ